MINETDETIKKRLESIFPDPRIASSVVDMVVHAKPLGWSRKSCAPYYKRIYAEQVKDDIDRMIETGNRLIYRYSVWCSGERAMSKATLYIRINQSIRFLIEQMDTPDGRYKKWYESVDISREPGLGVVIAFIQGLSTNEQFKADLAEPKEYMPVWKQKMEDWIESDDIKPFIQEGLALSPQEIEDLKVGLRKLPHIMASITSAYIKLVRISQ